MPAHVFIKLNQRENFKTGKGKPSSCKKSPRSSACVGRKGELKLVWGGKKVHKYNNIGTQRVPDLPNGKCMPPQDYAMIRSELWIVDPIGERRWRVRGTRSNIFEGSIPGGCLLDFWKRAKRTLFSVVGHEQGVVNGCFLAHQARGGTLGRENRNKDATCFWRIPRNRVNVTSVADSGPCVRYQYCQL
ncbi:hypothetical protein ABW19_dt0200296 [Dactylella cylindrospora]|nr:hypothetical protein ABW19_dt0200296 [Dactylella cylindrospora]